MNKLVSVLWVSCIYFAVSAYADQVLLINGDRLTGSVTTMADGVVTVETSMAGTVSIPAANIQKLTTDSPVTVVSTDGTTATKALTAQAGLSGIAAINPPAPEKPRWHGDISAGMVITTGNTKNESYNISANLKKRTEKDRTTLKADALNKREKTSGSTNKVTTEDWLKTAAKYDYFLSEKWFAFAEGRYETDDIANLDSRIILGGGSGYQWIESDTTNLSTEVGLSCLQEDYQGSNTDSKLSARGGYHFDHAFNSIFSFYHDLTVFPSTEEVSDYYLTSNAELRAKLNNNWFINAKVLLDYDTTPATGKGSTDVKYLFGTGLSF